MRKRQPVTLFLLFGLTGALFISAFGPLLRADKKIRKDYWASLTTPREIYRAACVTCHGVDGTGVERSLVGFDVPLPDFTDCSFATREPDADWFGIVYEGGPTRAFDRMMPAFGGALTDGQIEKALEHVRAFCADDAWPRGELNLPRPLITEKAYPEDELVWSFAGTTEEPVMISGKFIIEKRIGARHQVEVIVPFGAQQIERTDSTGNTDTEWGEGIGDIAVGAKSALLHSLSTGSIVSLAGEVIFPTGDEKDGFGKGIFRFEPFLAVGQLLGDAGFLHLQAGAELSTDTDVAGHELFWRGALGMTFTQGRFGRAWSPMIEVTGGLDLEEDAELVWDAVPQLQVALSQRQHIFVCAGARIPITEMDFETRPITVMAYLLWDWFDGGFTDGW